MSCTSENVTAHDTQITNLKAISFKILFRILFRRFYTGTAPPMPGNQGPGKLTQKKPPK